MSVFINVNLGPRSSKIFVNNWQNFIQFYSYFCWYCCISLDFVETLKLMSVFPVKNFPGANHGSMNCSEFYSYSLTDRYLGLIIKGCVLYIFTSAFFMSKRKDLWNKEKCFLFHFESSFRSWDNQILNFQIFKCHDVIKCLCMKHETHFIE